MKYTVNRRFYDTEAATKLAEVKKSFGEYGKNPDNDWTESLYRKPNGEYFVFGNGGKNSPFAEYKEGKNQAGGRVTVWRSENESSAKLWVHDNVPGKFDEIFSGKKELSVTTITISPKARQNLKRYSEEKGMTVSEIIRQFAEGLYEE